jgi:hypothetical protein
VPGATPGGGGLPADHDVELVFVDEQHHERTGGVAVEGADDGESYRLVGGAVDEAVLGEGCGRVRLVGNGEPAVERNNVEDHARGLYQAATWSALEVKIGASFLRQFAQSVPVPPAASPMALAPCTAQDQS